MRMTAGRINALLLTAVLLPWCLNAASVNDVTAALDLSPSGGISCTNGGSGWSKKKAPFTVKDAKNIAAIGGYYLECSAQGKAEPRKSRLFTVQVKGAGTVSLRYQVSLDDYNDSEFCAYEGSYDDGYLWGDSGFWCEGDYSAADWWLEDDFDLDTEVYTHTITFALYGPTSEDYEALKLDKEWKEFISKKAWLDYLRFTPDPDILLVEFYPDVREVDEDTFVGSQEVELYSPYENVILRYSTNGSIPNSASPIYTEPFTITATTTVNVLAFEGSAPTDGKVYTATYYAQAAEPTITANKTVFFDELTLNFSSDTAGVTFFYALGGANPVHSGSQPTGATTFSGSSVTLKQSLTVKVLAWRADLQDSEISEREIEIRLSDPVLSVCLDNGCSSDLTRPYFSEQAAISATHSRGIEVLRYRLNGGIWRQYTGELAFDETTRVEFQAQSLGATSSNIREVQLVKPATPFTLPSLAPGWNLLSLPGQLSQQTADQLIEQWQPLIYDRLKRTYARASRLDCGQAFWVFSDPNQPLEDQGNIHLHPLSSVPLLRGYNLLGHPGVAVTPLAVPGARIWLDGCYQSQATLAPGQGIWQYSAAGGNFPQ